MTQNRQNIVDAEVLARAQGCMLGQLAGDALGSLVEFWEPEEIREAYPHGVRELADGGTWGTIAGQPTDDSEMALSLARMLVDHGRYDSVEARKAYVTWLDSDPFDCGKTVYRGLVGRRDPNSQANGALMRISPLGIFGAYREPSEVAEWARQDAALTHPHPVCIEANALFARAIAHAIRTGCDRGTLYREIVHWAEDMDVDKTLLDAVVGASFAPPDNYGRPIAGWVLVALRNALWQLLNAVNVEEALVDTIMRGGDTDTTAAICGALLGAVEGRQAIPPQWTECLRKLPSRGGNTRCPSSPAGTLLAGRCTGTGGGFAAGRGLHLKVRLGYAKDDNVPALQVWFRSVGPGQMRKARPGAGVPMISDGTTTFIGRR